MSGPIVKLAAAIGGRTPAELIERIGPYREEKVAQMTDSGARGSSIIDLVDLCDCLEAVAAECQAIHEIRPKLAALFSDADGDAVILSSIHRSKGLEADRVFILRPDLIPHPRAEQPWEREQERNLAYVAATRAKVALGFNGEIPGVFRHRPEMAWR